MISVILDICATTTSDLSYHLKRLIILLSIVDLNDGEASLYKLPQVLQSFYVPGLKLEMLPRFSTMLILCVSLPFMHLAKDLVRIKVVKIISYFNLFEKILPDVMCAHLS